MSVAKSQLTVMQHEQIIDAANHKTEHLYNSCGGNSFKTSDTLNRAHISVLDRKNVEASMHRFNIIFALLLLVACSDGFSEFPVTADAQKDLATPLTIVQVDATNVDRFNSPSVAPVSRRPPASTSWNYLVGPGDILSVLVFNHPELTLPAGPDRSAEESGFRVQSDGTFFYPFVGQVQAAGLSLEQIRSNLSIRLADFIADPQLEVRVASFNSQAINVTGAVTSPQRIRVTTVPITLIDAVNAAGGLAPNADPRQIRIVRNGSAYKVDLNGFLERSDQFDNPLLGPGDVVYIPKREVEEVFVLGEVASPSSIDMGGDTLSLTQALTRRGGLEELRADARGIFVFRKSSSEITVFQFSVESPIGYLLGTRFFLKAGDVVYVTRSPRQRWNDAIFGLVPSVTALNSTTTTLNEL